MNCENGNTTCTFCLSCMEHFNVPGLSLFIRDDVTLYDCFENLYSHHFE